IPVGFAHGFQTLTDRSEVFYQMGDFYDPVASRGIRYNDPTISVQWPLPEKIISANDEKLPSLDEALEPSV
ncbi:MAG: dTDP-4-dehydrorhamnose 3,5-epimerase family protein, partial [Pirellulales bacterium]|nr:dTDP-4-dehydrorhamnose 3,5-epimerase family protein [Pirellulales bacterium]